MIDLVRAELLKLRSARSYLLLAAAVLVTALIPLLAFIAPGTSVDVVEVRGTLPGLALGGVELSAFLVMLLGVVATAGEFHHRTAVGTFLATPARWRVVAAKVGAMAVAGAALTLAAALVSLAVMPAAAALADVEMVAPTGVVVRALLATTAMGAAFGVFGVAIGGLIRNQTAAALVAFGWFFVAEGLLPMLLGETATDWLPGNAAAAVAGLTEVSKLAGLTALAVWAAVLAAGAARAVAWRDVA